MSENTCDLRKNTTIFKDIGLHTSDAKATAGKSIPKRTNSGQRLSDVYVNGVGDNRRKSGSLIA